MPAVRERRAHAELVRVRAGGPHGGQAVGAQRLAGHDGGRAERPLERRRAVGVLQEQPRKAAAAPAREEVDAQARRVGRVDRARAPAERAREPAGVRRGGAGRRGRHGHDRALRLLPALALALAAQRAAEAVPEHRLVHSLHERRLDPAHAMPRPLRLDAKEGGLGLSCRPQIDAHDHFSTRGGVALRGVALLADLDGVDEGARRARRPADRGDGGRIDRGQPVARALKVGADPPAPGQRLDRREQLEVEGRPAPSGFGERVARGGRAHVERQDDVHVAAALGLDLPDHGEHRVLVVVDKRAGREVGAADGSAVRAKARERRGASALKEARGLCARLARDEPRLL